jgi:hypothetical protein
MSYGQRPWVPLMKVTGYVSYESALIMRQLEALQNIPRTVGFSRLFKD